MDGDLSLSQSFGGLRIANPDDASPPTSRGPQGQEPTPFQNEWSPVSPGPAPADDLASPPPAPMSRDSRTPTDPQPQTQSRRLSIFNILRRGEPSADVSPASYLAPSQTSDLKLSNTNSNTGSTDSSRTQNDPLAWAAATKAFRSIPSTQQGQQQAIFPPYQSNPMQNGSRGYNAGAGGAPSARPISAAYSSHPPNGKATREANQYRLRSESSNSSIGVPSREASHRDRSYSQSQPMPPGSGPLPPRRSSRAIAGGNTDISSLGPSNGSAMHDTDGSLVPSNEEWKDKGAALGVREEYDDNGKLVLRQVKKGVRDFVFGRTLGEGSYSTVLLATDRQTLKEYAVKILDKKHIIKEKKIKYVNIEKDTLNRLIEHPGIVRLYYTFQDSASLYYVLDIASGGELLGVLKKIGSFDEECTRFYGAQILDAIEHMHNRGVIHRDLKPENVLLDDQMHIKITDFGTAKLLPDPRKPKDPATSYDMAGEDDELTRAQSFVGTAEYVSPELLTEKNACKASDLWAFGCIIYQLLTGRPPFKAANEYLTFQKIVGLDYAFPPGFPPAARDLVERLLVLDPQRRLSIEHIKNHEFFDGIQWGRGLWRMKAPRLKPYIPAAQEPNIIRLNDYSGAPLPTNTASRAQPTSNVSNGNSRPQPRIITELPPPTQLDIEWSPVLTRNNERILKLGNLMVLSAPLPHSPSSRHEHGETQEKKKLSRFFGSSTTKKRQRLVMVTSSARIILAAAGGEEKKTKLEISLLAPDCSWRTQIDAKGHMVWCVDTHGTHYTFEDLKSSATADDPSKTTAEEWIESVDRAKDLALSQSMVGSYTGDAGFDLQASVSTPSSTLHGNSAYPEGSSGTDRAGRHHLTKSKASLGEEQPEGRSTNKRNRFSKRASKNGLSTPF
ncbi:hypothetical protein OIDMADRAFT_123551 [Oidiodendron maius Zn]|uniref:non-specific serine/threonine protein kinase n=1 Tax=Oidiodendron maius (strain Zn) TaxID=913774 RepID=A0A0C3CR24_OIDMZ|nr:hypothetical protein OIDMADRAFT_123551 [Oidiodendron maius Zn]